MLQRIQSLYLLLAALVNTGAFFTPLYDRFWEDPQGWIAYGFAIAASLSILISLASIFLYNNRPRQITVVRIATIFQYIALGFAAGVLFSLGGIGFYLWDETIGVILLVLGLIGQYLAVSGIKKDEELVRSMDRIR